MPITYRPYQEEAIARFVERHDKVKRGGLIVLPTGSGKSLVMAGIAEWWLANRSGGVGIISHRIELMKQNANEYEALTGRTCYREQGSDFRTTEWEWEKVSRGGVISFTVQTLQNKRISRISERCIGLALVDEAHRIRDKGQYCKVQEYFGCKWAGFTATPDRTDGQGLIGPMFDECWFDGKLSEFVKEGWLVPPRVQHVHVGSLQWKWLKGKSGKDFTSEQVQKVWQDYKSIHEFTAPIVREVGQHKKTLYFCPGVAQAKGVAEVINSMTHPRRTADYVASYQIDADNNRSDFPKDRRRLILRKFGDERDELQHVANMGVFTEGTNVPIISAIGWLRVTKSRLLLAQGVGRAFRTWPGILDGMERASARERREAIARSPKPFALIFDPTKRAGTKLKFAHVIDLFAPADATPALRRRMQELLRKSRDRDDGLIEPEEIVAEAQRLESAFYKGLRAALLEIAPDVSYRLTEVDPYGRNPSHSSEVKSTLKEEKKNLGDASDKQKRLVKMLSGGRFADEFYESMMRKQAGALIDKLSKEPCQPWIISKLAGKGLMPKTNKEGLAMLRNLKQGQ